ncbi:MAG: nitroreductase family protein [Acidobacteriota bacterium]
MSETIWSVMSARHCKRAFLDRPVRRELLAEVLRAAADAPSSRNTQPWHVSVLAGASKDELARQLTAAFDRGQKPAADFLNNPHQLTGAYAERARVCGAGVLASKGIERDDDSARHAHVRDNFSFYGAPVEMIFHLAGDAVPGSFLATGCFLQNLMLGLVASGLGSCPQYSIAGYADIIRRHLGLAPERRIVCGLAIGYVDDAAPVNGFVPERASLEEFVDWC